MGHQCSLPVVVLGLVWGTFARGADSPRAMLTVFASTPSRLEGVRVQLRCAQSALGAEGPPPLEVTTNEVGTILLPLRLTPSVRLELWPDCEILEGEIAEPWLVGGPTQLDLREEELPVGARPVYSVDYDLVLDAEPGARVEVHVVSRDGKPLDGVVSCLHGHGDARSERVPVKQGRGGLGAPTSAQALRIEARGFVPVTVPLRVVAGQPQGVEVRLERMPDHGGDRVLLNVQPGDSPLRAFAPAPPASGPDAGSLAAAQ